MSHEQSTPSGKDDTKDSRETTDDKEVTSLWEDHIYNICYTSTRYSLIVALIPNVESVSLEDSGGSGCSVYIVDDIDIYRISIKMEITEPCNKSMGLHGDGVQPGTTEHIVLPSGGASGALG